MLCTCDTLLQNLQVHTVSVASFSCTPHSVAYHTASRVAPEQEGTQSTLWLTSTRVSQQLQLTKSYKFSYKSALFMPSHMPHCDKNVAYK